MKNRISILRLRAHTIFFQAVVAGLAIGFALPLFADGPRKYRSGISTCIFERLAPPSDKAELQPVPSHHIPKLQSLSPEKINKIKAELSSLLALKPGQEEDLPQAQHDQALKDARLLGPEGVIEVIREYFKGQKQYDYAAELYLLRAISLFPEISDDLKPLHNVAREFSGKFVSQSTQRRIFTTLLREAKTNPEGYKNLLLQLTRDKAPESRFGSEDWFDTEIENIFKNLDSVMLKTGRWNRAEIAALDTWLESRVRKQLVRVEPSAWTQAWRAFRGTPPKYELKDRPSARRALRYATARHDFFKHLKAQGMVLSEDVRARENQVTYYTSAMGYFNIKDQTEKFLLQQRANSPSRGPN